MRQAVRALHYSLRTEDAYVAWARRYILFHNKRHPLEMGAAEINQFLTHLAVQGNVAASTQNQAMAALLFLYERVLERPAGELGPVIRAKRPKRLPVVLTKTEVARLLAHLTGTPRLIARLLYGSGLRLEEGLRLRVQGLDFEQGQILVRHGKGGNDRRTMLPRSLQGDLQAHLARVRDLHPRELAQGVARCCCRKRWTARRREQARNGCGSGGFRRPACRRTRARGGAAGITRTPDR